MSEKNGSTTPKRIEKLPAVKNEVTARDLARCSSRESRKKLRYEDAQRLGVLPLNIIVVGSREILTLITGKGLTAEDVQALRFACGSEVRIIESSPEVLEEAIFIAYKSDLETVRTDDVPELLKGILEMALAKGASDLVLIPHSNNAVQCSIRLDGRMIVLPVSGYSPVKHKQIVNRIRVLGSVSETSRDAPQDGRLSVKLPAGEIELRFHIFPTIFGEKVCIRLPISSDVLSLSELGLSSKTVSFLQGTLHRLEGAVILSGPTGSGKTTTLYSIVHELAKRDLSIVSLEDPVEKNIGGVSQTDLSRHRNMTYATGLKQVLRQDPDVILIGEIRDSESARTALEAAATGHLVLSAVHGSGVLSVVERLVRLSEDRSLVSEALSLILTQRLLPKLCADCKVIDCEHSKHYGKKLYQPTQCSRCFHTGYRGRVLLDESIFFSEELRRAVLQEKIYEYPLHETPFFHGIMHSIEAALVSGEIDLDQAKRIIPIG